VTHRSNGTLRLRLAQTGVLDRFPPKVGPAIVDVAEQATY
jgi:hypothetical protein